jgi:hypothetical protein
MPAYRFIPRRGRKGPCLDGGKGEVFGYKAPAVIIPEAVTDSSFDDGPVEHEALGEDIPTIPEVLEVVGRRRGFPDPFEVA